MPNKFLKLKNKADSLRTIYKLTENIQKMWLLDKKNIAIRTGHHCAQPFMKYFKISGNARMSVGIYNSKDDIDYFIKAIENYKKAHQSEWGAILGEGPIEIVLEGSEDEDFANVEAVNERTL